MLKADGCTFNVAVFKTQRGPKNIARVRFGEGKGFGKYFEDSQRCPDCGTTPGHYHHFHCAKEECGACGGQLLFCECAMAEDAELQGYQEGFLQ
jgi:hypothetical protein